MPKRYGENAIQKARELFCKFGGKDFDAIEKEMQKDFPTWRKQNLIPRGKKADSRLGWIIEYNFEKSLAEYQKIQIEAVTDDVQKLYLGIKKTRERLEKKAVDGTATRDELYSYRDFCKLETDTRAKLDLEKDNFEGFAFYLEKMLAWLPEIDMNAAKVFLSGDIAERILEKARIEEIKFT
jgi:hypothetical protein